MNLKTWEPLKNELKSIYNKRIMRKSVKYEGIIKKNEKKQKISENYQENPHFFLY